VSAFTRRPGLLLRCHTPKPRERGPGVHVGRPTTCLRLDSRAKAYSQRQTPEATKMCADELSKLRNMHSVTLSTQYCNNRIHSASCDSVCCIYAPTVLIAFLNSSGAELLLPTPTGCLAASLRLKKTKTAQKNAQARSSAAEHVHNEESGESRQTSERTAYCAEKKKRKYSRVDPD